MKRVENDATYPLTCRRLENVGIDPNAVPVDGLSLQGYVTAPLVWSKQERARARRTGMLPRTFHRWTIPQETRNAILAAQRSERRRAAALAARVHPILQWLDAAGIPLDDWQRAWIEKTYAPMELVS